MVITKNCHGNTGIIITLIYIKISTFYQNNGHLVQRFCSLSHQSPNFMTLWSIYNFDILIFLRGMVYRSRSPTMARVAKFQSNGVFYESYANFMPGNFISGFKSEIQCLLAKMPWKYVSHYGGPTKKILVSWIVIRT